MEMLAVSQDDMVGIIAKVLYWDVHTVESLIVELRRMRLIWTVGGKYGFTEAQVRVQISGLIEQGRMDMAPNGRIFILENPDPQIERFQGAYYLTRVEGTVKGPFATLAEVQDAMEETYVGNQIPTQR